MATIRFLHISGHHAAVWMVLICATRRALGMISAGAGEEAADGRAPVQAAEAAEGAVRVAGEARRAAQRRSRQPAASWRRQQTARQRPRCQRQGQQRGTVGDWRPAGPPCGGDHCAGEAQSRPGAGPFNQQSDTQDFLCMARCAMSSVCVCRSFG